MRQNAMENARKRYLPHVVLLVTVTFCGLTMKGQSRECSVNLSTVQKALTGQNHEAQGNAVHCVGNEPDRFTPTFPSLLDIIRESDTPPPTFEAAIWAAGRIAEKTPVDTGLASLLAERLTIVVRDVKQAVTVRKAAAYTLGRLSESLATITTKTKGDLLNDPVMALTAVVNGRSSDWLSAGNLDLLASTTDAIGYLGAQGETVAPPLIKLLHDLEEITSSGSRLSKEQTSAIHHLQGVCATTLGQLSVDQQDQAPAQELLHLLSKNNSEIIRPAIFALATMGPRPEIQEQSLLIVRHLSSGDAEVRRVAAYAVGRVHSPKDATQSLEALQVDLRDPAWQVREAASQAVEEFEPLSAFNLLPSLTSQLSVEPRPNVRAALARTISTIVLRYPIPASTNDRQAVTKELRESRSVINATHARLNSSDPSYSILENTMASMSQAESNLKVGWFQNAVSNHPAVGICFAVYGLWIGICLLVFYTWPLKILPWNQFLGRFVDLDIPLPFGLGRLKIPFRYALFVGALNYRPRVLDAWVVAHASAVRASLSQRQTVRERQIYVPLPVAIRSTHITKISSLTPDDLHDTCNQERWCVRIIGEGGSGKTSLACRLALWCLESDPSQRLFVRHRALPLLIEPGNMVAAEAEGVSLADVLRFQLQAAIKSADPIDAELYLRLIRAQRVVVVLDGASETTLFTKEGGRKLEETFPASALIVTARNTDLFGEGGYTDILPQRIDSDHLIPFMNTYLQNLGVTVDDSGLYEACRRLALMVGKNRGITPLLAQMYARTLVRIADAPSSDVQLPTSVPELMFTYLEVINRAGKNKVFDDLEVQRASKRLALECIRENYRPGRANKGLFVYNEGQKRISPDLFVYLEQSLRLIDTVAGASYQFVLDPLAEYFGAMQLLEENRDEHKAWSRLLKSLDGVSTSGKETLGFLLALSDSLDWKGKALNVPSSIMREIKDRAARARLHVQAEYETTLVKKEANG